MTQIFFPYEYETKRKYKCLNTQMARRRNVPNVQNWPLLPDELTIREEKNAKTQWTMLFRQGHARGAYSSNCFLKRFIW